MIKQDAVHGLPTTMNETHIGFCNECAANKIHQSSFSHERMIRANGFLDLIHTDICGPMKTQSHSGCRFFIKFIDDYSRKGHVYFLKAKNEAFEKFQDFKALVENETGRRIKILCSDRGGEYIGREFDRFLRQNGIRHQLTAPYSPQQNGIAERYNRTIVEIARTMLHAANLLYINWAEAVHIAVYIQNRCITQGLVKSTVDNQEEDKSKKFITPEEMWSGEKPYISHLRTFGCEAYVKRNTYHHKFEEKGEKCIFLRYELNFKSISIMEHTKALLSYFKKCSIQ